MSEPRMPDPYDRGRGPGEQWQSQPHWQDSPDRQNPSDRQNPPHDQDPRAWHDQSGWQDPSGWQDQSGWQDPSGWQNPPHDQDRRGWQDSAHDGYGHDDQWQERSGSPQAWQDAQWQQAEDPRWTDPRYGDYQYPQDPAPQPQPGAVRYAMWRSRKYLRVTGILIAVCVAIAGFALSRGSKSSGQRPGQLTVDQYHAGLCIAGPGAQLSLGTSDPWPRYTTQVPCTRPHVAEVIYAGDYWGDGTSFPAVQVRDQATGACATAFIDYVGISPARSRLRVDPIVPDAASWGQGSKRLECVAWQSTSSHPQGASLTGSVKNSRR